MYSFQGNGERKVKNAKRLLKHYDFIVIGKRNINFFPISVALVSNSNRHGDVVDVPRMRIFEGGMM